MTIRNRFMVFHRNRLFRDCLSTYLRRASTDEVLSIDHIAVSPIDALRQSEVDLILLDLNLPDGVAVEITNEVSSQEGVCRVIILVPDDHDLLVECIAKGAHGCLLERSSLEDLDMAISRVLQGEVFCSPEIVATMFSEIAKLAKTPNWRSSVSNLEDQPKEKRLTAREQDVLELLNQRKSNKEIASALSVSLFTVKSHVHNILEKLNVESRIEAVDLARRQRKLSRAKDSPERPK